MKNKNISLNENLLILCMSMLFCGVIAILLGKDIDWDLANYHYSNAFLFLHHHANQDLWPPSYVHIHFAPTADLLSYFLINYFSPLSATFISGAIHGINIWLLFLIARLCLPNNAYNPVLALMLALIGTYGAAGFTGIGNFKNDHLVTIFVLTFIYFQIKSLQHYSLKNSTWIQCFLIGGLFLGIALGLKLTAASYIISAITSFCCLNIAWRDKIKYIIGFGIACGVGFILSSGYWLWTQWTQYHNPVFPFFNSIFHSPDYSSKVNLVYPFSTTGNIFHKAFYYLLPNILEGKNLFDLRYFYLDALLIITFITVVWHITIHKISVKLANTTIWLCCFMVLTHIIYQHFFYGLRYIMAVEMLAPLLIYLLTAYLISNTTTRNIVVTILFVSMIFSMSPDYGTRMTTYRNHDYFNVAMPAFVSQTPEATALISYPEYAIYTEPRPLSYLTAFFPKQWHFVGIPFAHQLFHSFDRRNEAKTRAFIANKTGKFYLIASELHINELYKAALNYNLIPAGNCDYIDNERSRLLQQNILICPVIKF
jgi:hypothetical protein